MCVCMHECVPVSIHLTCCIERHDFVAGTKCKIIKKHLKALTILSTFIVEIMRNDETQ